MKMKKIRKFRQDKKGVSSLFIAIFIALLSIMLISTLFVSLVISSSALTDNLRLEQEKMQESIKLQGPNGLELLPDQATVKSLRVKNNGAIPVRIRALYIGQEFICDPSEAPNQDTFIAPGKEKWIDLFFDHPNLPIILDDDIIESLWTVATERGTRSSETGADIQFGKPGETSLPQFYIGPLMIFFDMFNWKSADGEWQSGWTIPKTADEVTWRILLRNVDQRQITLRDTSFFNLVCNNNIPNNILDWYIDDDAARRVFNPGQYHYVHFTVDKNGKPQGINSFQEWTSCINFLVLTGIFEDGSYIGQTIPFEAVLVTPEPELTITANPSTVPPGYGTESKSLITVTLTDSLGTPIPNSLVHFSTNLGAITEFSITDLDGVAQVTFTAGLVTGRAALTATSQGASDSTTVTVRR